MICFEVPHPSMPKRSRESFAMVPSRSLSRFMVRSFVARAWMVLASDMGIQRNLSKLAKRKDCSKSITSFKSAFGGSLFCTRPVMHQWYAGWKQALCPEAKRFMSLVCLLHHTMKQYHHSYSTILDWLKPNTVKHQASHLYTFAHLGSRSGVAG